nr:carboxypeptidase B-like [Onthophagus taurus]
MNYKNCTGVDLNKNFNIHWKPTANCETSSGPTPFSEPETTFIKNEILKSEDRIKIYLSLHCCGAKILHPWGYTKDLPENINPLLDVAQKLQKAMNSVRNTQYVIGSPSEWDNIYGSSFDWAKSVGKIDLSYMIKLAGPIDNYIVPEDQIIPSAKEVFEGLKAIHRHLVHMYVNN